MADGTLQSDPPYTDPARRLSVAVIGTGISGLSAAWLLGQRHDVTVYEKAGRLGGHSNTVDVPSPSGPVAIDTGFIVYNCKNYPNLTALFDHLGVATQASDMSFAVSRRDGALEYAGHSLSGLLAQRRNVLRPRFWSMLRDLVRFYGQARRDVDGLDDEVTLGDYLDSHGFGAAFRNDHLLPMAAAIWSAPPKALLAHPAGAFIRFCVNHGLLNFRDRPAWRTVTGGSREYVKKLTADFAHGVRLGVAAVSVQRTSQGVSVRDSSGEVRDYDHVVIGTHADQALALLADPTVAERDVLGAFKYQSNLAVLHSDSALMPKRRAVWSSWNYLEPRSATSNTLCVTYWMNRLQAIDGADEYFLTLNPCREPRAETIHRSEVYEHPIFDVAALRAQKAMPSLQGQRNTWFCGAYCGAGFHEDGLKAGLAVAEALGGTARPWAETRSAPIVATMAAERERPHLVEKPRSALYVGRVVHERFRPRRHRLNYRAYWMLLDLDELPALAARLRLFSIGRFNLFSFHNEDYGSRESEPLRAQIERHLRAAGIDLGGGAIRLLAMPRVLGYAFNPISVYFCHRADGGLAALVYEVHNTFRQRHSYMIAVEQEGAAPIRQHCEKRFYVSPFLGMDLNYDFTVVEPEANVRVLVQGADRDGPMIVAALTGKREPLSDARLLGVFFSHPLLTIKVIAAIHWEAARLWSKGVRVHPRPPPPDAPVTAAVEPRYPRRYS